MVPAKLKFVPLFILFLFGQSSSSFALVTGDVVIIGMKTDGTDEFSWLPLVALPAGEVLYFTDAGYFAVPTGSNEYNVNGSGSEWLMQFTTPAGGIAAGVVQTVISGSVSSDYQLFNNTKFGARSPSVPLTFSTTSSGDQVMVFQSTDDPNTSTFGNTSFNPLFAISSQCTEWLTNTDGDGNQSDIHPGLADGVNAVAHGASSTIEDEFDNIRYVGITDGDKASILAEVANDANWEGLQVVSTAGWSANGVATFTGLPVEFTFFQGFPQSSTIVLNWGTASEFNNHKFEIQHSRDGRTFQTKKEVKGNGSTQIEQSYHWVDKTPFQGINYYRLKQIDYDGVSMFSKIIVVQFNHSVAPRIVLFPMPASSTIHLQTTSENYSLELFNLAGKRLIFAQNVSELDVSALSAGSYFLKTQDLSNKKIVTLNVKIVK